MCFLSKNTSKSTLNRLKCDPQTPKAPPPLPPAHFEEKNKEKREKKREK